MKRSDQLAPLSRDHHIALEIALALRRATADDAHETARRLGAYWTSHGDTHFELEESALLTAFPADDAELQAGAARVHAEHRELRELVATVLADPADLVRAQELGILLSDHVRYEERTLFPLAEERLDAAALDRLGRALAH